MSEFWNAATAVLQIDHYFLSHQGGAFMCVFRWFAKYLMLGCLLCCQSVIAQDTEQKCPPGAKCPEKEKPKYEITPETITVTTSFQDGAVTLEPTKTVIDMTKFESSSSVDRIEDVLKHVAGIDIIQGTGGVDPQQVVLMRGFDDSRFIVAMDGRPITAPTAGADTFVDWSSLTMGDIDRIEIIRGAASARYENAAGGVINIITKKGKRGDRLAPKVFADSSYSSFNTVTTRGTISGGVGDLGYFINFGTRNSDGFLRNNYYDGMDYSGRLNYALPNKGRLSASFKRSDLEHGYPVVNNPNSKYTKSYDSNYPLVKDDADTLRMGRLVSYPGGRSFKVRKAAHLDIGYDQPIGNTNLSLKLFGDRGSEDSYSYQLSGTKLSQTFSGQNDRKESVWGALLDYQINLWARNTLSVGLSHRRMGVVNNDDSFRISGAYIEDQYSVTRKLTLNLGIRFMAVREYSYAYKGPGDTASYRHRVFTKLVLPKFTATYHFDSATEAFFSVNQDYHLPGC
jgi:outer membrane cobalamin receptor